MTKNPTIIQRRTSVPAYIQLAEHLKSRIQMGHFQPGARMQGEQELIKDFGLSRITVRAALKLLERDGWVVRRQGVGTFAGHAINQELSTVSTIPEVLMTLGVMPDVKVLSFAAVRPPEDVRRKLKLETDEQVLLIRRLYRSGRVPIALVHVYLPLAMMKHAGVLRDGRTPSETTYTILERNLGVIIKDAQHVIKSRIASREEARALKIKSGSPILVLERLTNGVDGRPLEYDVCHYYSERYTFSVTVPRRSLASKGVLAQANDGRGRLKLVKS
jgi:GntR family transcriptional regulator